MRIRLFVILLISIFVLSGCATSQKLKLASSDDAVLVTAAKGADAIAQIPKVTLAQAKILFDSGEAIFVDARGEGEYDQSHIKGALSFPTNVVKQRMEKYKNEIKDKILVSYCHGAGCHLADKTAKALFNEGHKKVAIFFGGWPKWNEHKYPIDEAKK